MTGATASDRLSEGFEAMTTSQPRYQDLSAELDRLCADQLFEDQPTTPRPAESPPAELPAPPPPPLNRPPPQLGRPTQPVPPPQFGRLTHSIRLSEASRGDTVPSVTPVPPVTPVSHHESRLQPAPIDVLGIARIPGPLADFRARAVSFLIDYVAPVVVLNLLLAIGALTGGTTWRVMLVAGGYLWLLGFCLWNSGYLQGTTGQSLGRRVASTKLVGIGTGEPVGPSRAVVRQICHLLELGIGFLRPLWDGKHQTVADKIVGTVVVHASKPAEDRDGTDHRRVGE